MILSSWKGITSIWEDEDLSISEAEQLQLTSLPDLEGPDLQASSDLANSIENPLSSEGLFDISGISRME